MRGGGGEREEEKRGQREYWEAGHQEPSGHIDKGLSYTGEEQLGGRDGLRGWRGLGWGQGVPARMAPTG